MPRLSDHEWRVENEWDRHFFLAMCNRVAASTCRSSPEWRANYIALHRRNLAQAREYRMQEKTAPPVLLKEVA